VVPPWRSLPQSFLTTTVEKEQFTHLVPGLWFAKETSTERNIFLRKKESAWRQLINTLTLNSGLPALSRAKSF
jgi:hypothetical protein